MRRCWTMRVGASALVMASMMVMGGEALGQTKAAAQPSKGPGAAPATPMDPAEEHFRRGNTFYKEQKYAEAEAAYEEALSLRRTHDIASNLGHAEMKQQKYAEAAEHLSLSLQIWPPTASPERRTYAQNALAEAKTHVHTVTVTASVAGAQVFVDGVSVGLAPLSGEVFLKPGAHTIEARLAEYEQAQEAVTATAGRASKVELRLTPKKSTGPVVPPPPPPPKRSLVPVFVLGGVAVAGIAAGAGMYVGSNGKLDSTRELADTIRRENGTCKAGAMVHSLCEELESTKATGRVLEDLGIGSIVVGGLAAVGAVVYVLWPQKKSASTEVQAQVSVAPLVGDSHGVLVHGSF
jgi:hypothetical protein